MFPYVAKPGRIVIELADEGICVAQGALYDDAGRHLSYYWRILIPIYSKPGK